jgi:hypothetical protein
MPTQDVSADSSPHRGTKFAAAGIAVASAAVLAVTPVTPTLPEVSQRAVALTALASPITAWTDTLADTFTNLAVRTTNSSTALTGLAQAVANPTLYAELVEFVGSNALNPLPLLDQLLAFEPTYGDRISIGAAQSTSALLTSLSRLPLVVTNTLNYLAAGEFVEAYAELDIYFLVNLLEQPARPLFSLLPIPGDIAAALPGGERLATILDTFLTRGGANGIAKALLVAPITTALALAETLDFAKAAFEEGDAETAANHLINLPATLVNAFVNGYSPDFEVRSTFPGIFGQGGPVDYFLNILPKTITTALTAPTTTPAGLTTSAHSGVESAAPTNTEIGGETVTVDIDGGSNDRDSNDGVSASSSGNTTGTDSADNGDGTGGQTEPANAIDNGANSEGNDGADSRAEDNSGTGDGTTNNGAGEGNTNNDEGDGTSGTESTNTTNTAGGDTTGGENSGDAGNSGGDE